MVAVGRVAQEEVAAAAQVVAQEVALLALMGLQALQVQTFILHWILLAKQDADFQKVASAKKHCGISLVKTLQSFSRM